MECGTFLDCGSLRRVKIVERFGYPLCSSRRCSSRCHISRGIGGFRKRSLLWASRLPATDAKSASSYELNEPIPSSKSFYLAGALYQEQLGKPHLEELPRVENVDIHKADPDALSGAQKDKAFDADCEKEGEEILSFEENGKRNRSVQRVDVRAISLSLMHAKTADDIKKEFKNLNTLPLPVYSSMIRGLGARKSLDSAFAIVEWLKCKNKETGSSVSPNLFIYNSLLSAVKLTRDFDKVDEVIEDMKSQGITPNVVTYNTLMSVYLEQGRYQDALNVLDAIDSNGLSPSPVTYSTILLSYKKMGNAFGAVACFAQFRDKYQRGEIGQTNSDEWKNEFVKLEKFTVSVCNLVMRKWLVNDENPAPNIFKLLVVMDEALLKPNRIDYERLLWACTRESHYTVAREFYSRIRGVSNDISLSVCNHVIWLMGKAKKWWAALGVFEDLLEIGPNPNNLSYELILSHFNFLLTAARKKGMWKWGVRLINKMQEKGLRPGSREWNAVLVACSKASETSVAVQIFARMVEQGEKPTVVSYGALLSALEKGKLYDEALSVWEHMGKVNVKPNLYAYTILVSVYIGKGSPEMVESALSEMRSVAIEPTVVTFNAIISACAKNGTENATLEWFRRMKDYKLKPNETTYEILVEALARNGKPRLANEMYLRACDQGFHLSSKAYNAVSQSLRPS